SHSLAAVVVAPFFQEAFCMSQPALNWALALMVAVLSPLGVLGADRGGKLHVLLVLDTLDYTIGQYVQIDEKQMLAFLKAGVPASRLSVTVLKDNNITRQKVLDYYSALRVAPRDTVLFYYSGHGAWGPQLGHYLSTKGGALLRSDLSAAIARK